MQLSDIRTEIRDLTGTSSADFSDTTVDTFINRGEFILVDICSVTKNVAYTTTVVGQEEYELTGTSIWYEGRSTSQGLIHPIKITRAEYDENVMTRISYDQISSQINDTTYSSFSTDKAYYIKQRTSKTSVSTEAFSLKEFYIGVFPSPSDTKNLRIYYIPKPILLLADTDIPGIQDQWHESLVYYGAWKIAERTQNIPMIGYLKAEWYGWLSNIRDVGDSMFGEGSFTIQYSDV